MASGEVIGKNVRYWRDIRGMSAAELARQVPVRVFSIQQIEAGKTERSKHLPRIAQILGVDISNLDPDLKPAATVARAPLRGGISPTLPVYGVTQAGDGVEVLSQDPIDEIERPSTMAHVRDAYAVIVSGDSMVPSVRPGDTVVVNPNKVPRREDICVFRSEQDGVFKSTIKEFTGQTTDAWRVRRYRPEEKEYALKRSEWSQCHVVVTIHRG